MCKCNPSVKTPFCCSIGCEWPEENKMKTLDEKIREFAHELFGYDDDIVDYTAIESFYDGANFVKAEMQSEIDQLKLELKNKDAVRLWNENEKLKVLLNKSLHALDYYTVSFIDEDDGQIARENIAEIKKEMGE